MTAVHPGAAGEIPAGAVFVPGQTPDSDPNIAPEHDRRWVLFTALGGGTAAVAGVLVFGRRWLGRDGGSGGNNNNNGRIVEGGGGAVAAPGDIQIDAANIYHIQEVVQNSSAAQDVVRGLFGTPELSYRNPGRDLRYPWLQISSDSGASLTMTLRPVGLEIAPGERVRTWEQARRPETQVTQLYSDTVVSINDQFPAGRTIANVTGWTNIGTPDERMFTVDTQFMPTFSEMAPETRRDAMLKFTHAMFQVQALG